MLVASVGWQVDAASGEHGWRRSVGPFFSTLLAHGHRAPGAARQGGGPHALGGGRRAAAAVAGGAGAGAGGGGGGGGGARRRGGVRAGRALPAAAWDACWRAAA